MLRGQQVEEGACYTARRWRKQVAMNMLASSYRLFAPASRIAKLESLAAHVNPKNQRARLRASRFLWSLDPAVLDAFRITTCFENLFKARLLLAGYVIHRVSRQAAYCSIERRQRSQPIRIGEIKKMEGLRGRQAAGYSFASLSPQTLRWSTLVGEPAYRAQLRLPDRLFDVLKTLADKRNTLHFLALEASTYNVQVVEDLRYIRTCFNRFVVQQHNRLVLDLGFRKTDLLSEIRPIRQR